MYDEVFATGSTLLNQVYKALGLKLATNIEDEADSFVALNTLPWARNEFVHLPDKTFVVASGDGLVIKPTTMIFADNDPPVKILEKGKDTYLLQNEQLIVTVEQGCITSLYDRKAEREIIPRGAKANQFVIFDDKPVYWQAWDVEVYHLETRQELCYASTRILENTSHQVSVVTEFRLNNASYIKSTISLSAAFPGQQSYVECAAEVSWQETMKFLKVEFPVDIHSTEASYETQYGIIKRPTHYNTS